MGFLEPVATLLGITVTQLVVVTIAAVALVIGWYVLKAVVKAAAKVLTIGCFTIIVVVVGLYLFFAFFV